MAVTYSENGVIVRSGNEVPYDGTPNFIVVGKSVPNQPIQFGNGIIYSDHAYDYNHWGLTQNGKLQLTGIQTYECNIRVKLIQFSNGTNAVVFGNTNSNIDTTTNTKLIKLSLSGIYSSSGTTCVAELFLVNQSGTLQSIGSSTIPKDKTDYHDYTVLIDLANKTCKFKFDGIEKIAGTYNWDIPTQEYTLSMFANGDSSNTLGYGYVDYTNTYIKTDNQLAWGCIRKPGL